MTIAGLIVLAAILLIGGYYIHTASKLGRLHQSARNTAGELDTLLWDRNHILDQIIQKVEAAGISVPEEHKKPIAMALGMLPIMQMSVYKSIDDRGKAVFELANEKPELVETEEMKKLMGRFTNLKIDISECGSRYNLKATEFNAFINRPLGRFLAGRKKMSEKNHFNIALAEVSAV